jgi:rhomboid protease GluP
MRRVAELSAHHHYSAARKLAAALVLVHPSSDLRHQLQMLRTVETLQAAGLAPPPMLQGRRSRRWSSHCRNAPAVLSLILINVAAFIFEVSHHHWSEPTLLHRLGALEPYAIVFKHEYWRLLAALFLHASLIHLLFNLFALYVLGPPLERAIGFARFCACYLVSGLGSGVGVIVLWLLRLTATMELVGASGCIMGIVGAWAAFLLRHRHVPVAKQRLQNVLLIVAIQIAFDLTTPEVSMSAHLFGLVTGFIAGLALAPATSDLSRSHLDRRI